MGSRTLRHVYRYYPVRERVLIDAELNRVLELVEESGGVAYERRLTAGGNSFSQAPGPKATSSTNCRDAPS